MKLTLDYSPANVDLKKEVPVLCKSGERFGLALEEPLASRASRRLCASSSTSARASNQRRSGRKVLVDLSLLVSLGIVVLAVNIASPKGSSFSPESKADFSNHPKR